MFRASKHSNESIDSKLVSALHSPGGVALDCCYCFIWRHDPSICSCLLVLPANCLGAKSVLEQGSSVVVTVIIFYCQATPLPSALHVWVESRDDDFEDRHQHV